MIEKDSIIQLLLTKNPENVGLGYRLVHFFNPGNIEDEQLQFASSYSGFSYKDNPVGRWNSNWFAFASDEVGAPIFVDLNDGRVYTDNNDQDNRKIFYVATTLENYIQGIRELENISEGRETPEQLRDNPIPEAIADSILERIDFANPGIDLWYWELFMENYDIDTSVDYTDY